MKLGILAAAEVEIVQARDYLEGQATGLGNRFVDDLSHTLAAIASEPQRFRKLETLPENEPYRRALLTVFRYAVVFEILSDRILVVAVCHTRREPARSASELVNRLTTAMADRLDEALLALASDCEYCTSEHAPTGS